VQKSFAIRSFGVRLRAFAIRINLMNQKISIVDACAILRHGGLVAFPTETVYGLGADAKNPAAVAKIFAAKQRPADHPLIVHIADSDQIREWSGEITTAAQKLIQHFWPGPLTLILPRAENVLECITGGQNTIGLRMPQHPVAQALLQTFGSGIAAPSANRFGHISPTRAEHVWQELGNSVDLILDGGDCEVGIESTIVDVSGEQIKVLRPGIISAVQLSLVLGEEVIINTNIVAAAIRTSGMLLSHYAPQTPLQLISTENLAEQINLLLAKNKTVAVLARRPALLEHADLYWFAMPNEVEAYAHELYARLRAADQLDCSVILVEAVPQDAQWLAVHDRLSKAVAK
jgi:L-threonylcarbamoyladenylate synthase